MIADPHRPNALSVGWAEGPVVVAKQMTWRFMMIASRSDGYNLYGLTNSTRSIFHILTRLGDLRRGTDSCWRRTRFSASSRARHANQDRVTSSSWVRNATIDRFSKHTPTGASSRRGFREAQGDKPSGVWFEFSKGALD